MCVKETKGGREIAKQRESTEKFQLIWKYRKTETDYNNL